MSIFNKKKTADLPPVHFERIYQNSDGTYLPDSSQPDSAENYEITARTYTPHTSTRYINAAADANAKKLPELYTAREDCCGCTACYAICPAEAIIMRPCEEGFLYPVVDAAKCVRCYRCIGVCPIKNKEN